MPRDRVGYHRVLTEATSLIDELRAARLRLATAESCTGGLIAAALTDVPGSSDVLERGYVTYSNEAKIEAIGVPEVLIHRHGAVSGEVARAMAEGALDRSRADIAIAVTGVAGPGGGSAAKPVGLVHLAAAREGRPTLHRECRFGDQGRGQVRLLSVIEAFGLVRALARD